MAVNRWIVSGGHQELLQRLLPIFNDLGLEVDQEFSTRSSIYARERPTKQSGFSAGVSVLFTTNQGRQDQFVVEVRCAEPMLSPRTKCEKIAHELRAIIPPIE